jgi:hypothetical protein
MQPHTAGAGVSHHRCPGARGGGNSDRAFARWVPLKQPSKATECAAIVCARHQGDASMTMTRAFSRSVCRVLIGVLLFAQFAVAAHACPILAKNVAGGSGIDMAAVDNNSAGTATPDAISVGPDESATSPCDDMTRPPEPISANLRAEHCQYGQQTFDSTQLPSPAPALFTVLYVVPAFVAADSGRLMPASTLAVPAAALPPLTILHCRFRI